MGAEVDDTTSLDERVTEAKDSLRKAESSYYKGFTHINGIHLVAEKYGFLWQDFMECKNPLLFDGDRFECVFPLYKVKNGDNTIEATVEYRPILEDLYNSPEENDKKGIFGNIKIITRKEGEINEDQLFLSRLRRAKRANRIEWAYFGTITQEICKHNLCFEEVHKSLQEAYEILQRAYIEVAEEKTKDIISHT